MKRLIWGVVFLLCLGLTSGYAKEELSEIKGKLLMVELEPSKDPANPNFWPCLVIQGKQNMLVGTPNILEELSYLRGKAVTLKAKQLPSQKIGGKEYGCFEVNEIKKMGEKEYISSEKITEEFKAALQQRGVVDKTGGLTITGPLKSIWFDKNENGVIDSGDRLFMVSKTTGKSGGKYLLYASQAIVRGKDKEVYYDTFIFKDPFPKSLEPAVLGKLNYDAEKNSYSVEIDKICNKEGEAFGSSKEKTISITENKGLKPYIGKQVLLIGDKYETLLWFGDEKKEINRIDGQYLITVQGKISLVEQKVQAPWKLSLVLLKDNAGNLYELRQVGYTGFWKDFLNKEFKITGLLRPVIFYNQPTCVMEVTKIEG